MDDATTSMSIPWQGVHLQHPRDGSADGWATIITSRGTFVVRSVGGAFTATPLGKDNPGPDARNAERTSAGIILGAQDVELRRIDGVWMGNAHLSGSDLSIEDPRP